MTESQIIDLRCEDTTLIEQLAHLAHAAFQTHAPDWLPTIQAARDEVLEALEPGKISRVLIDAAQQPLGWIGAILYQDPAHAIATIQTRKEHPYTFYTKLGFKIVGIIPDADGVGKPAITLAKRVRAS